MEVVQRKRMLLEGIREIFQVARVRSRQKRKVEKSPLGELKLHLKLRTGSLLMMMMMIFMTKFHKLDSPSSRKNLM